MTTLRPSRQVRWLKSARREFDRFPHEVRFKARRALTIVALGSRPEVAKPLHGLGSGVWELAIKDRGQAFRVVYVLQIGDDIWVIHAFQKKSKSGIAPPKTEMDVIRRRIRMLKP